MDMDLIQLQQEEKRLAIKKAKLEIKLLEHRLKVRIICEHESFFFFFFFSCVCIKQLIQICHVSLFQDLEK